jgi:hypothetical protein
VSPFPFGILNVVCKVSLISLINSTKTERCIKTIKPCRGITHHNGVLLWCEDKRGIQMMKLSEYRVTTLVKQDNMPHISYHNNTPL